MPFGYWLVRATKHVDIRTVGSGNIGATNVWRTYGRKYGLPVVLLDPPKGFVPALRGPAGGPPGRAGPSEALRAGPPGAYGPLALGRRRRRRGGDARALAAAVPEVREGRQDG